MNKTDKLPPTKKIALITGCSTGIGYHCARQLSQRQHWRVYAGARQAADVARLQSEGLESLPLDLACGDSIRAAVEQIAAENDGRIDALFNNGAYGQPGAVEDLPRAVLREQFETNVFGTQELTNAVIPLMRRQGGGRIVQNSSVLGFVALAYRGAYNASKYALEGLSDTLRLELHGSGIRLSVIEPGPISSDFRKNANAKFRATFNEAKIAESVHREAYTAGLMKESGDSPPLPFNLGPEAVYAALLHALESPRPKLRYRVTVPTIAFWYLKRLLPTAMLDAILRRI